MGEFKHTPGPWEVTRGGELMLKDERIIRATLAFDSHRMRQIRTIARTFNNAGTEESLANARLIAAAPEMLDALLYVKGRVDGGEEWWIRTPERGGFDMNLIDAAIAKATGDTTK